MSIALISFLIMALNLYYVSYIYCASVHRKQEALIHF